MASKQVTDRDKSARAVAAAADTHAGAIADGAITVLTGYLQPDETMPDVALLARLLGRWIDDTGGALSAADQAHIRELADDAAPRAARDDIAGLVRDDLIGLRSAVYAAHGTSGLAALGIDAAVSADPAVLAAQAQTAVTALRDPAVAMPSAVPGLTLDRAALADQIELRLPALVAALDDVAREQREAEATLVAKRAAMAVYDRAFSRGAACLSALAGVAGHDDLAARVRPSRRRPGRLPGSAGDPADPVTDADDPDDADDGFATTDPA